MASWSLSRTIVLRSSNGVTFEVDEAVALESQTIKQMIQRDSCETKFRVCNVTSKILSKVIEYCKKHVETLNEEDLKLFDADFVDVDMSTLLDLCLAADRLKIKSLLDLTCRTVTGILKDRTTKETTRNDFSPEEKGRKALVEMKGKQDENSSSSATIAASRGRKALVEMKDKQVENLSSSATIAASRGRKALVEMKGKQVENSSSSATIAASHGTKAEWEDWDSSDGYFDYYEVREKYPGVYYQQHLEGDIAKGDIRIVYKVPGWAIQEARHAMLREEKLDLETRLEDPRLVKTT